MDKKSRELVMGKLYLKNKEYLLAEKSLNEYLNSCPEDFQALKLLAQVYEQLRKFSRAFELYERCYLAEPDRKGVLLDICRLLLMNDPSLDHVDQKKWSVLAIQSFPANPIVANLRESLNNSKVNKTHDSSLIDISSLFDEKFKKIEIKLNDLSTIDERLKQIEAKLDDLSPIDERLKQIKVKLDDLSPIDEKLKKIEAKLDDLSPIDERLKKMQAKLDDLAPAFESKLSISKPACDLEYVSGQATVNESKPSPSSNTGQQASSEIKAPIFCQKAPNEPKQPLFGQPSLNDSKTSLFGHSTLNDPKTSLFGQSASNDSKTSYFGQPASINPPGCIFGQPAVSAPKPPISEQSSSCDTKTVFGQMSGTSLFSFSSIKQSFDAFPSTAKDVSQNSNHDVKKFENKDDGDEGDDGDDNGVAKIEELPIENTCNMKPIDIKSGEEDEDILFEQRCKLFRFRDKEYKERGLGNIKVLKHKETGNGRLIMRRDAVNLVCLNCFTCTKIERVKDTQVRFAGLDASDGDAESSVFIARFKTEEMTSEFEKLVRELFD